MLLSERLHSVAAEGSGPGAPRRLGGMPFKHQAVRAISLTLLPPASPASPASPAWRFQRGEP